MKNGQGNDTYTYTHTCTHNSHTKSRIVYARERICTDSAREGVQRRLIVIYICACVSSSTCMHACVYIYINRLLSPSTTPLTVRGLLRVGPLSLLFLLKLLLDMSALALINIPMYETMHVYERIYIRTHASNRIQCRSTKEKSEEEEEEEEEEEGRMRVCDAELCDTLTTY